MTKSPTEQGPAQEKTKLNDNRWLDGADVDT